MKNLRSSIASLFIVALVSACPPTGPGPGTQNGLPDFSVGVKVRGLGTGTIDSSAGPLKFDFLSYTQTVHGGVTATLTAKPDTDSTFIGWTGSCSGIGTCDVRGVTATEPLEARFGLPGSWNQRFTTASPVSSGWSWAPTGPSPRWWRIMRPVRRAGCSRTMPRTEL